MAGKPRTVGPTSKRAAANIRRIRRQREVTTAALSQRLEALGHPIADTGITKTEKGDRRVDVDDLVALALALGVTPNTLLLPQIDYLGGPDAHHVTPVVSGTAEELWLWAQGEKPLPVLVPDAYSWLGKGEYPSLEFAVHNRPYLTAPQPPDAGLRPYVQEILRVAYEVLGIASRFDGELPDPSEIPGAEADLLKVPGARLFPGAEHEHEAATWDTDALTLGVKIRVIAIGRRLVARMDEEERHRRTGLGA